MVESGIVNVNPRTEPKPPVGVIESLGVGFETVISHAWLLLIPVILDLFLWVGPKVSFEPLVDRFEAVSVAWAASQPADVRSQLQAQNQLNFALFDNLGQHINILSLFNTAPVGVPSLMVENLLDQVNQGTPSVVFTNSDWRIISRPNDGGVVPLDWQAFTFIIALIFLVFNLFAVVLPGFDINTAVHSQAPVSGFTVPLTNELQFVLLAIALPLIGLLLTALYYSQIGLTIRTPATPPGEMIRKSTINWAKLTAFNVLFRVAAVCIGIPFVLALALMQLVSVELTGVLASLGLTFGLWLMVYISFTTQSMVLQDRGVFGAVWDSIRLVHVSLISVIGLTLLSFVVNWGMSFLFTLPGSNSWLTLLGILGHAFVSTSLVAATFVFYKDRHRWWTEMRQWVRVQTPLKRTR